MCGLQYECVFCSSDGYWTTSAKLTKTNIFHRTNYDEHVIVITHIVGFLLFVGFLFFLSWVLYSYFSIPLDDEEDSSDEEKYEEVDRDRPRGTVSVGCCGMKLFFV
jgi:hypothetical protein